MPDKWAQYAQPAQSGADKWAQYAATEDAAPPDAPKPEPGFFSSLGKQFGIDPESMKEQAKPSFRHAVEAMPGVLPLEGAYNGFMRSTGELGKGVDAALEGNSTGLASHAISALPFVGPAIDRVAEQAPAPRPGESYLGQIKDVATNPGAMGTLTGAAAQVASVLEGLGVVDPIARGVSAANQKLNPFPLRSRAVNTFKSVAKDVGNRPVQLTQTDPAVRGFQNYVRTGGQGNEVVNKLVNQTSPANTLSYPDAEAFAKNVGRQARKPPYLRRLFEDPAAPDMRRNLGPVQQGLKGDLTSTAGKVGRAEDFTAANREYANNAKLRKLGLIGAGIAGEEAARQTGLIGKIVPRFLQ